MAVVLAVPVELVVVVLVAVVFRLLVVPVELVVVVLVVLVAVHQSVRPATLEQPLVAAGSLVGLLVVVLVFLVEELVVLLKAQVCLPVLVSVAKVPLEQPV